MKMNFKFRYAALCIAMTLCLFGCKKAEPAVNETTAAVATEAQTAKETTSAVAEATKAATEEIKKELSEITIVYTNDIHSYIANTVKPEGSDKEVPGLRISKLAALVSDLEAEGRNVIFADAGDEIQGNIYGAFDEGVTVVEMLTKAGLDVATPGNHEFDYGMNHFFNITEKAGYEFVSCNFKDIENDLYPLGKYKMFDFDGTKVAIIGVTTPQTMVSSTPVYFQNEKGEFIYTFDGVDSEKDLYESIQRAIDEVKDEADYVIAIGHLGVGTEDLRTKLSSINVIENTTGLTAFIDGHSHSLVEADMVKDLSGNEVLLTQTGSYLDNVGIMTISSDGTVSTELISDYERENEEIAAIEEAYINTINEALGEKIATIDVTVTINNPENEKERLIRARELNIGDFAADAFYWFFNEKKQLPCDLAIINSGAIRTSIKSGEITKMDVRNVMPFNNMLCLVRIPGQIIIDALEYGAHMVGEWDDEWDSPAEFGGFLQVAGIKYTVDASEPTSVKVDETGMFVSVDGDYRVKDVMVYNRESDEYEPIDPDKLYLVAGTDYILRNGGNGMTMFAGTEAVAEYVASDSDVFMEFSESFAVDGEYARINNEGSPLSGYDNYLMDYENPYGAGRIELLNVNYDKD
ncbi:MAG: bifunctional UDP-sugar hydrolase/5'-nucleotidase [Eubacteriales bacterium]|nr:bifunctional UDP-sugar hydrolase/5'-nucleotidase [Eubacteriales bacterium]